ncbi:hypothetical protein PSD17_20850 [Pseudonocardia sp. D17]|uniref:hypothetical protein n=1 Tax=Pseudonocardia sp. D17 TaxID=882661 RepID=UPI0030CF18A8|nr:hypothetical protein PSD17_20850 [Pseudonocardia sp. D17]
MPVQLPASRQIGVSIAAGSTVATRTPDAPEVRNSWRSETPSARTPNFAIE